MKKCMLLLGSLYLCGCATITEGTGQSITIATEPAAASCKVERGGMPLGSLVRTPASIRIEKSKNDIQVTCEKDGYEVTTVSYSPAFNDATFGNIILGGGVGAIVDASTGANYNYPAQINLTLPKKAE